ncbi:hypothetical protein QE152_g9081 [Popillia japonica]|uniref:Uncharacterized protein n=1 Tax=Popillia japonica TaxID=7064 RepID=A0AAW1LZ75_POPJA
MAGGSHKRSATYVDDEATVLEWAEESDSEVCSSNIDSEEENEWAEESDSEVCSSNIDSEEENEEYLPRSDEEVDMVGEISSSEDEASESDNEVLQDVAGESYKDKSDQEIESNIELGYVHSVA